MRSFDLSACLARGENLHTEFKSWPIPPDDLAAAIVAFANTGGGRILLGVDDRGAAVGVGDLDRTTRFGDNVASHNCPPPVTVLQESFEISGNAVVSVGVPKGDDRPYRTNRGVYYVRTSSGRRHASREELLRLFQLKKGKKFGMMFGAYFGAMTRFRKSSKADWIAIDPISSLTPAPTMWGAILAVALPTKSARSERSTTSLWRIFRALTYIPRLTHLANIGKSAGCNSSEPEGV